MAISNKKKIIIIISANVVLLVGAAIALFVVKQNNVSKTRPHDNWMPNDIEWTVYLGDAEPAKNRGYDGDYYVIINNWDTYKKEKDMWNKVGKIV